MGILKLTQHLWNNPTIKIEAIDSDINKIGELINQHDPQCSIFLDHSCNLLFVGRIMNDGTIGVVFHITDATGGYRVPNYRDYEQFRAMDPNYHKVDAKKFRELQDKAKAKKDKEWSDWTKEVSAEAVDRLAFDRGIRPSISLHIPGRNK